MSHVSRRVLAALALALLVLVALLGAAATKTAGHDDELVVLSTTDVKGKTSPCG